MYQFPTLSEILKKLPHKLGIMLEVKSNVPEVVRERHLKYDFKFQEAEKGNYVVPVFANHRWFTGEKLLDEYFWDGAGLTKFGKIEDWYLSSPRIDSYIPLAPDRTRHTYSFTVGLK